MQDVINMLLEKKANSTAECEAEKVAAIEEIDNKYAERLNKIDELLSLAGYVPPVEEESAEVEPVEEVAAADETADVDITAEAKTQTVY